MTAWDRLEPNSTDATLLEGLQARVADPLWMLARQWQSGEFDGEDAASPVRVLCRTESHALTRVRFGDADERALDGNLPLEPLVEAIMPNPASAEDVASINSAALAALPREAGSPEALKNRLRALYPFDPARYRPDHPLPAAAERRLRLLARHAFDPFDLADEQGRRLLAREPGLADWVMTLRGIVAGRGRGIAARADAWNPEALAYEVSVSGRAGGEDYGLRAVDYGGGRLDWYSFDRDPADAAPPVAGASRVNSIDSVPLPLAYAGQPAARYWEFEDGEVHYGGIAAGPADIARMIVADFAAIGGDDTFVVPLEVPVGSVSRVRALIVVDSFGEGIDAGLLDIGDGPLPAQCHRVPSATQRDRAATQDQGLPFDLFALSGEDAPVGHRGPWLPVLPVTANAMNGRPLERVSLRRDEEANLAWAVEETIEGPFGAPLRRRQMWQIDEPASLAQDEAWPYRLQTPVPPWWIPLVPERIGDAAQMRLRRARLGAWEAMDPARTGPKSRLMDPTRAVTINEAAVPASGTTVERHWQLARAYDGQVVLWQSWHRKFGATDRASGLAYDAIARKW